MVKPTESILDHFGRQSTQVDALQSPSITEPSVSIEPVVTEPLKSTSLEPATEVTSAPVKSMELQSQEQAEVLTEAIGAKRKEGVSKNKQSKKPKQVKQYCATSYGSD
jgi:hypothetical protein